MKNFMKKIFFVACLLAPALLSAQQPLKESLDPAIRVGKLENGLTYYLCHNNLPENRVEFYIAQRVGSILEKNISVVWRTSSNIWRSMEQPISPGKTLSIISKTTV